MVVWDTAILGFQVTAKTLVLLLCIGNYTSQLYREYNKPF